MKNWIKGGLISLIIFGVIPLVLFWNCMREPDLGCGVYILHNILVMFVFDIGTNPFFTSFVILVFWFIIGAIIGWLIGKIKKR